MAALVVKSTVRFQAFTPALLRILNVVYACAQPVTCVPAIVITSVNDSTHDTNSRHYTDEALDVRTKNFPSEAAKVAFATALKAALGPAFTVLYESPGGENQHLHCQPKRGTVYRGEAS